MRKNTANAIKALCRMDTTVTREVRMSICEIVEAATRKRKGVEKVRREMSVSDAATLLGLSHVTVWHMCKDGRLKAVRRGRKFFVDCDSVEAMRRGETATHCALNIRHIDGQI